MSKFPLASLIILLNINLICSDKIFKIPFKIDSTSSFFPNKYNPVANKYMSQMTIELSIGNPQQKLKCSLNLKSYHSFFLSHKIQNIELPNYYNKSLSSSYFCTKNKTDYANEIFNIAESFTDQTKIYSSDNNLILDENLNFLLIDDLAEEELNEFYAPGQIGLKLNTNDDENEDEDGNFIYQIINQEYSRNSMFFFEFNENDENGNFVIGKDVYYNDNYLKISIKGDDWALIFDKIIYGNEVDNSAQAIIETDNGLIIGTIDYEEIIKEFFSIQKNCYMNKTKMGYEVYNYFFCNENLDETKMDNLTFYFNIKKKELNFTFTGKDLFFIEDGKKYFKIIFFTFPNYIWYFGREFLKKYQLIFDIERKIIYVKCNNNFSFLSYFTDIDFWTIVLLLFALIIVILLAITCLKRNKRKKRKNELEKENMKQEDLELLNK